MSYNSIIAEVESLPPLFLVYVCKKITPQNYTPEVESPLLILTCKLNYLSLLVHSQVLLKIRGTVY